MYKQYMCNFSEKCSKTYIIFFRKSNYFMSAICKFQFIYKKQHFSKPNSFDNFHFTLILLSNDLQYLCFFRSNFIHKNTLEKKRFFNTEDFYIVSPCQSIKKEKNGTHNFLFASPLQHIQIHIARDISDGLSHSYHCSWNPRKLFLKKN